jgi:hypothetical protein
MAVDVDMDMYFSNFSTFTFETSGLSLFKFFDFNLSNLSITVFACMEPNAAVRVCDAQFSPREYSLYRFSMTSRMFDIPLNCATLLLTVLLIYTAIELY